tara:strand:+ start:136 stop:462 length:327 start_codon:yes stop_codon:yes gene_type:complete
MLATTSTVPPLTCTFKISPAFKTKSLVSNSTVVVVAIDLVKKSEKTVLEVSVRVRDKVLALDSFLLQAIIELTIDTLNKEAEGAVYSVYTVLPPLVALTLAFVIPCKY